MRIAVTVSIVIPVYNAERWLRRSVDSALAQDYAGVREIVLVDNNSTDGSAAIIRDYAERFPDRILAARCPVQGCNPARNVGLRLATGDWVQFLDADDELLPTKLREQLTVAGPDDEWLIGAYRNRFADGTLLDNYPHPDPWKGLVFRYRIGCTCSNLYRRATLERLGGWDENLVDGTDPELHFQLLRAGAIWRIIEGPPRFIYHHHATPGRVSTGRPVAGNVQRAELLHRVNTYLWQDRPRYFAENEAYFRGALLRALRILATHDVERSVALHRAWFGAGRAGLGDIPGNVIARRWSRLYRIFGFEWVERGRWWLRGRGPTS